MTRSTRLSVATDLTGDILVVAWHMFATLPDAHPVRLDFMAALWRLEDAIDTHTPVDAALVAVIEFVGAVS